jgi:hypothetical protein
MAVGIYNAATGFRVSDNVIAGTSDFAIYELGTDTVLTRNELSGQVLTIAANRSTRASIFGNQLGSAQSFGGAFIVGADTRHFGNQFTDGDYRGTCTLSSGECKVETHEIEPFSHVILDRTVPLGAPGELELGRVVANSYFVIRSRSRLDLSTVSWEIVH